MAIGSTANPSMTASRARIGSISVTVTSSAHAPGAGRDTLAGRSIAGDDEPLPGQQDVGGTDDAVESGLSRAVTVLEQVLGLGVIDGDDRVAEHAGGFHGAEAYHAGPRVLGAADHLGELLGTRLMQTRHEIASVVHGQLRVRVQDGVDVAVVLLVALAFDSKGGNTFVDDEASCDVVLGRKGVRCAREHRRPAGFQGLQEIRRLGRDVQAHPDDDARQRAFAREPLADRSEHGHLTIGPGDPEPSETGEAPVRYVSDTGSAVHLTRP